MSNKSSDSHRIDVSVGGVTYHLIANENESYMREIAAKADDALRRISDANPSLSGTQANVLLLINLFDNLTKIKHSTEKLKIENERLIKENEEKGKELFLQCDANFELKKELIRINELNKQLTLQLATLQGYDPDEDLSACENEDIPLDNESSDDEDMFLADEIIPPDNAPPEEYPDSYQPSIDEYFSNS